MKILGVSAGFHDAAAAVVDGNNGDILFASHSERYSKRKHDPELSHDLVQAAMEYGTIETVAYYENHWHKLYRQLRAGQPLTDFKWTLKGEVQKHFSGDKFFLDYVKIKGYGHHLSHAAAGFQTSPFDEATVVVIDAIGEMDTITIWRAYHDANGFAKYKLCYRQTYPHSIGLFYSAMTKSIGLIPQTEEYILMGMAAYGDAFKVVDEMHDSLVDSIRDSRFKQNLHIGVDDFHNADISEFDVAAATQMITEEMIKGVMIRSKRFDTTNNLVFMGGVALNCSANRFLGNYYNNIWIMPNPGDAGSSLGAAALAYGKKLNWTDACLGHNIEGEYPVEELVKHLKKHKIAGVANGRAEFGPRSLGNRSLLADPRGKKIKDKVNKIKKRQKFRPFAPVVLAEYAAGYFDMPQGFARSDYMQVTARCKNAKKFPAIVHEDGTSRVQTVPDNGSGIRRLLEAWHKETGCPMLLNTSLNIKGEVVVNDEKDAKDFQEYYSVKVFTKRK